MDRQHLSLVPIDRDGVPRGFHGELHQAAADVLKATVGHYDRVGFVEPWISYFAIADNEPVGCCSFKSPPRDGRVEIAYHTFPESEGRGFATEMAAFLIAIASQQPDRPMVTAQTLPDRNASHRILEKLGFHHAATVDHPEDGQVWDWHRTQTPDPT